jgi:hypothetical protein
MFFLVVLCLFLFIVAPETMFSRTVYLGVGIVLGCLGGMCITRLCREEEEEEEEEKEDGVWNQGPFH